MVIDLHHQCMRIVADTPAEFVLRDRAVWAFVIGSVFAALGIAALIAPATFTGSSAPRLIGAVLTVAGVLLVLRMQVDHIRCATADRTITVHRKALWGNAEDVVIPFDHIAMVELEIDRERRGRAGSSPLRRLALRLHDGTVIPLSHTWKGGLLVKRSLAAIGTRLAERIGVVLQEQRPPAVSEVLARAHDLIVRARREDQPPTHTPTTV